MHWIFRHFYATVAIASSTSFHNMKNDYLHDDANNRFFSLRDVMKSSVLCMYWKEKAE